MTQEMIQTLTQENEKLKEQNNYLCSQLDAHRGLLNEQLQTGISLRTNLIILQKQLQEMVPKNKTLDDEIKRLNEELQKLMKENQDAAHKKLK